MSKEVVHLKTNHVAEFTPEQLELIKSTVARGATNDELKLFLYRCRNMGLDPLKPGQVHFVKYGSNPGTMIVGIDGFRTRADATGLRSGTNRGIIRDDKGLCVAAWCEVNRRDWTHPARVEVSLSEYSTGKAMWAKMPETMLQKVAEVAALRMAFPDQLAGMYAEEEMHQAAPKDVRAKEIQSKLEAEIEDFPAAPVALPIEPSELAADYIIKVGKNKGKQIKDLSEKDTSNFIRFYNETTAKGESMHKDVVEYYNELQKLLAEREEI